jgi:hypothetical protein
VDTFRTVGDKEHAEFVRLYIEEGLGFNKIAEKLELVSMKYAALPSAILHCTQSW